MNLPYTHNKRVKWSDNGAFPGPSRLQVDHSYTRNRVGVSLQKAGRSRVKHMIVWEQHGLGDYLTDIHVTCMQPEDRQVLWHTVASFIFFFFILYLHEGFFHDVVKLVQF
jgi:hypothetical protein